MFLTLLVVNFFILNAKLIEKPRIKLYTNAQGQRNGEGLVTYLRPESVALAIDLLDDTEYRPGVEKGRIRVQQVTLFFVASIISMFWLGALIDAEADFFLWYLFMRDIGTVQGEGADGDASGVDG